MTGRIEVHSDTWIALGGLGQIVQQWAVVSLQMAAGNHNHGRHLVALGALVTRIVELARDDPSWADRYVSASRHFAETYSAETIPIADLRRDLEAFVSAWDPCAYSNHARPDRE